jgi:hypothetical protein
LSRPRAQFSALFNAAAARTAVAVVVVAALAACHAEPDDAVTAKPAAPKKAAPTANTPPPAPCSAKEDALLTAPFVDNFDRADLGTNDWYSTSYGAYSIRNGRLCTAKPRNHPLWLKRKLPANVRVEFEAIALSNNADIKVELFGDGCGYDTNGNEYTSTGYVAVLGAHNNTEHWLARLYEHGPEARKTPLIAGSDSIANSKLVQGTTYKFELARTDGKELRFLVNGTLVHAMPDAQPLAGEGHDHFAFDGWDAPVCFDKVTVTPL